MTNTFNTRKILPNFSTILLPLLGLRGLEGKGLSFWKGRGASRVYRNRREASPYVFHGAHEFSRGHLNFDSLSYSHELGWDQRLRSRTRDDVPVQFNSG